MSTQVPKSTTSDYLVAHATEDQPLVVYDVVSVDGDTVTVDKTTDKYLDEEEYTIEEIKTAITDGPFEVVDPTEFGTTEIKGMGPSTALDVYTSTGIRNAHELQVAYLTDRGEAVADAVRRVDYLHEQIATDPIRNDALGVPESVPNGAAKWVMLFLRKFGGKATTKMIDDSAPTISLSEVKKRDVTPEHVNWDTDEPVVPDSANVCMIEVGEHDYGNVPPTPHAAETVEEDGDYYTVRHNGATSIVGGDYYEGIAEVLCLSVDELVAHTYGATYGERPIRIESDEWVMSFVIAPRIEIE